MTTVREDRRAFTLVEAAITCAVAGVLLALVLPALTRVRAVALADREKAAARLTWKAWQSYSHDNRDKYLPAASEWSWVHPTTSPVTENTPRMRAKDPFVPGRMLAGSAAKTWTLFLMGSMPMQTDQIQVDTATRTAFDARSLQNNPINTAGDVHVDYYVNTRPAAYAFHPSVGMNATYIGGAYPFGGFRGNPTTGPNPLASGGRFYVTGPAEVRQPARLMVFCSTRGGDVADSGSWWSYGQDPPNTGAIRPGYWAVMPPRPSPMYRGGFNQSYALSNGWVTSNTFNPTFTPSAWGNIHPRSDAAAITVTIDGHFEAKTLAELRDMRTWSNYADSPNWNFVPGP